MKAMNNADPYLGRGLWHESTSHQTESLMGFVPYYKLSNK